MADAALGGTWGRRSTTFQRARRIPGPKPVTMRDVMIVPSLSLSLGDSAVDPVRRSNIPSMPTPRANVLSTRSGVLLAPTFLRSYADGVARVLLLTPSFFSFFFFLQRHATALLLRQL